jgi:hypothetical protein
MAFVRPTCVAPINFCAKQRANLLLKASPQRLVASDQVHELKHRPTAAKLRPRIFERDKGFTRSRCLKLFEYIPCLIDFEPNCNVPDSCSIRQAVRLSPVLLPHANQEPHILQARKRLHDRRPMTIPWPRVEKQQHFVAGVSCE